MAANFEYYKIFYYVAKYQNFTLAAKALLSSQPPGFPLHAGS